MTATETTRYAQMALVLNPVWGVFFRPQNEALERYSEHRALTHLGLSILGVTVPCPPKIRSPTAAKIEVANKRFAQVLENDEGHTKRIFFSSSP